MSFIHLHNHSDNSMLDGMCSIDGMIDWAVKNSAPAMAITDHGAMHGVYDFYTSAVEKGVKPIIGCEVYVAPKDRTVKDKSQKTAFHLTLLAENNEGYANLVNLASNAYISGFYYKPRIDLELLRSYNKGLILLTGCVQGQLAQLIWNGDNKTAGTRFKEIIDIMGSNNVYVEVQEHGLEQEQITYPELADMAGEYNIPIVATNDCHYLTYDDHRAHDVMLCIQTKKNVNDMNRLKFENQFYFKSMDEMKEALKHYPEEAILNTQVIADRCNVTLDKLTDTMPQFKDLPKGESEYSYLRKLCLDGLKERYGTINSEMNARIEKELVVIHEMGYCGYFLIVWDYITYAKRKRYPFGARGSAGGSLVLHALGVVHFNPIERGCMFERFLNPARTSMPDIDIDFADEIRDEIIQYVSQKYGVENVARVATFSTLSTKALVTDIGRSLNIPISDVKRLSSVVNINHPKPLDRVEEEVAKIPIPSPALKDLVPLCKELDGIKRHVSCHASAIVISNTPLTNQIPLFKDKHDQIASQFDSDTLTKLGVVKFDFLGLKTLTQIRNCIDSIKENHDIDIELDKLPLDDKPTYDMISKGMLIGLFQLEKSEGIRQLAIDINPTNFEEFVTITALYRPGPLQSGMTRQYINRKNGREKVQYLHDSTKNALKETYGVCVYQEQVMQISRDVAGFSMSEADLLRAAMGKLDKDLIQDQRENFVNGAIRNNLDKANAEKLFDILEPFAGYAFNKSHSVAYSLLTYHMAYLKRHYPYEFMASVMTSAASSIDKEAKIISAIRECKKLSDYVGIDITLNPPDINYSNYGFTNKDNEIRFGLCCIKRVSDQLASIIVKERNENGPYKSVIDLCSRMPPRKLSKKAFESLVKSGALDSIETNRAKLLRNMESILDEGKTKRSTSDTGQMDIFSLMNVTEEVTGEFTMEECKEWALEEKRQNEQESMGFVISQHPLDKYSHIAKRYDIINVEDITKKCAKGDSIVTIGIANNCKEATTKQNKRILTLDLQGIGSTIDLIILPDAYAKAKVKNGDILLVDAKVMKPSNWNSKGFKLTSNNIVPISDQNKLATNIEIGIDNPDDDYRFQEFRNLVQDNLGNANVIFHITTDQSGKVSVLCGDNFKVNITDEFINDTELIFGSAIKLTTKQYVTP